MEFVMQISELKVLKSNAGFYIGRLCNDPELSVKECVFPYDRQSGYYPDAESAQKALDNDTFFRP